MHREKNSNNLLGKLELFLSIKLLLWKLHIWNFRSGTQNQIWIQAKVKIQI